MVVVVGFRSGRHFRRSFAGWHRRFSHRQGWRVMSICMRIRRVSRRWRGRGIGGPDRGSRVPEQPKAGDDEEEKARHKFAVKVSGGRGASTLRGSFGG